NVPIFDLDFDAILAAMYALTHSAEGDCYLRVPPDPGIAAAALGASASAAPGTGESAAPGASDTTLTPLSRPVAVSLADPSGGPVLAHSSTVLPCHAAPSGLLSGLHLPSFSTNLVRGADLQDAWVDHFAPRGQRVTHCTCSRTGRHLATFTRRPRSSLYTLTTSPPPVSSSNQVAASSQVFAAASRSSPASAPCSCGPLSHETLLWKHRLGHPSLPRLRGMASHTLGHERYFLLVVDDYSRYTTVFPLCSKGEVPEVLIVWIRDRGGEFSSDLLRTFCPPPVPGTHSMTLRPSTAPQCVPLPSPPVSSLPAGPDPASDSLRAASPAVTRFLASAVSDPLFESTAASALVTQLVEFAAACRLDYATSLVAESASASVCPPSVGGECALGTDVLEDRQEDFECFAATVLHLVSMLLAPEGDPDAPDIPTPRSYAEAIEGPYSSQWQAAMDAEMASWKSTGTYVDEVPPPGANMVSGMWIFRVKRPPGSPPAFKACYVARGFSQRKGGSLHEEIWLRRPPGFTGSFPAGTQWSLWQPVYGLCQAPREWHDTLRTTLAALGFAPSTSHPSLVLRTDTTLPPFYVLVYVDDVVFATTHTEALAHVKSELQKRHTCTDLGELTSYLGLRITRDRAQCTITLTQSHMVQQVLQRFGFTYSSPQSTPLPTGRSLLAPPLDESVEPSGPYPELVGCLITSGMGLVIGRRARVVLTGHADASWVDDLATQRSSQGYTFSLGSGSVSWRSTRSSSVLSSSCEAEIYAGAMAAQELRWLTYLLTDLGEVPRSPPVLYVDNKAMLALCQEHKLEHRTKHIALRYFLARELQQHGQLHLAYVASQANTADVFTKALQPCDHQPCFAFLGWSCDLLFSPTLPMGQSGSSSFATLGHSSSQLQKPLFFFSALSSIHPHVLHPIAMAAPSDDDADDADGDPHCSHGPRTGLDFLRGPVSEPAPRPLPECSDESEGWMYPARKAAQQSPPHQPQAEVDDGGWQRSERDEAEPVVHDFVASTEMFSEVPESSNSVSLKKRQYTQSTLGYGGGSPLVKPAPPPPPVVMPSPSPLKQTPAKRTEAKFLEAQRNYITKWLPQFDWLLLDKGDDGLPCLRCSVCSEHGPDNARYVRNGSGGRDLQPASMRAHQASSRHYDCIDRQKGLLDKLAAQKKIDDYERADPEGARVTRLMHSIQFVCDEDAPIAMFPRLVDFLTKEGVSAIPQQTYGLYITQYGFTEMVKAMCTYQQQQQLMYIHASPWVGISCNKSTDRSRGKHLVVFATFMKERAVVTEFLALLTIHKCNAGSLFAVLLSHLDNIGIDLQRIVAVSTDSARVMIGSQSGLVVRLRQRVPHLVGTHCIAHRNVLAVKEAASKFPDLGIVDDAICGLGEVVMRSSMWLERFKELQLEIHQTNLEHQWLFDVRWLSRGDAVARLCRILGAAIVVFIEYNHSMAVTVQTLKFHFCLFFLADLLAEINALNKFFQRKKVDITLVHQEVDRTIGVIRLRYVEYVDIFGGGVSKLLSPFIARLGSSRRTIHVDGTDVDGEPSSHQIVLSDAPIAGHQYGGSMADCIKLCKAFALEAGSSGAELAGCQRAALQQPAAT
ncbi:unnamed protein product, partial [Closterium sp. NIES-53]